MLTVITGDFEHYFRCLTIEIFALMFWFFYNDFPLSLIVSPKYFTVPAMYFKFW